MKPKVFATRRIKGEVSLRVFLKADLEVPKSHPGAILRRFLAVPMLSLGVLVRTLLLDLFLLANWF